MEIMDRSGVKGSAAYKRLLVLPGNDADMSRGSQLINVPPLVLKLPPYGNAFSSRLLDLPSV